MDSFMAIMSCFTVWVPVLLPIVVLVAIFGGFRNRAMLVVLLLVVATSDVVVSDTLKKIVNRARPRESVTGVRIVTLRPSVHDLPASVVRPVITQSPRPALNPHGHSFPSGHTMNNFSAATVLLLFYRRRGWLYFIPAATIAYSRVYVGAHWPSDVFVSMFLGVGVTLLLMAGIEWFWRSKAPHWCPDVHARHPSLIGEAAA